MTNDFEVTEVGAVDAAYERGWNEAVDAAEQACQERADLITEFEMECCQATANLCATDVANLKKGCDQ